MFIKSIPFLFQRINLVTLTLGSFLGTLVGCNGFQPGTEEDPSNPPPPAIRDLSSKVTLFGIDEASQEALVLLPGKNLTLYDKNWNPIQSVKADGWQTGLVTEDNRHAILQSNIGGTEIGSIQLFDGPKRTMLTLAGTMDSIVEAVVTSTEILAVDQGGLFVRWNLAGNQVDSTKLPQSNSRIDAIDFSLDGKWIFFVQQKTLFAYEIGTKTVATSLDLTPISFVSLESMSSVRVRKQMAVIGSKGQILRKPTFGCFHDWR